MIIPEQPLELPVNTRLTILVEVEPNPTGEPRTPGFRSLPINLDARVSRAIAEDPQFGIEES